MPKPKGNTMIMNQLMPEKFPMLSAFRELNLSLSNTAQSAPHCNADFTELEWYKIEMALRELPALEYVHMAYGSHFHHEPEMTDWEQEIWDLPAFRAWAKTWE